MPPAPVRAVVSAPVRALVPAPVISAPEEVRHRQQVRFPSVRFDPRYYLSTSNQPKASESLIKLSSRMCYVIYDTVDDLVTLQKELEKMEVYVDLQKMRFGDIDSVFFNVQGNPSGSMIAPMLFIPFIENAFKHTDEVAIKKGIEIRCRMDDNSVEFTCRNYISHKEDRQRGVCG